MRVPFSKPGFRCNGKFICCAGQARSDETVEDWIGCAGARGQVSGARGQLSVVSRQSLVGSGGIVTMASVKAYAEGLRRLMGEPNLCRTLGENARRYCAKHYSRDKIIGKWVELLKGLI